jgi:hypothetical protein
LTTTMLSNKSLISPLAVPLVRPAIVPF